MTKPIRTIKLKTMDGKKSEVEALIDTGSFYTIIRQDCVPAGAKFISYKTAEKLGTAKKSGQVRIVASAEMILEIDGHPILEDVRISPDLKREFILGAKTMQAWDISIKNKNGHTKIHVGHDMNDPDIQAVE